MTLQKCRVGSIKTWITVCVSLFGLVVAGGAYAQCATTIIIPDNGSNTEIARFVSKSLEGYVVRNPEGYVLSPTDNTAFESDLNDDIILVPGIDTGLTATATVTYNVDEWIIVITGADAVLDFTLSYWNGTTSTCPGGVQGYCGSSVQITSTHSAECAASYFVSDTCTNSEYCGAADVGTGYCYEGVCEQLLDCSDAQYTARTCTSNDECGDGGGCNSGVCECMTPGPGVCYPGVLDPICFDDDDCGGTAFGTCELGYRYQCVCADGPVCGNGALEGVEECDDGNNFVGDGCDDACAFERPSCEILLPAASVASGSSISIQILSQMWVTSNTARLHTGYSTYHSVSMTNGIGTRNNVLYRTAGNYVITGIVYNPLDVSNNTFAECTGDLAVYTDGDCGSLLMQEINEGTYNEPIYDDLDLPYTFCDTGVFDQGTYTYTAGLGWTWDCEGEGGGAVVSCSADELPVCGPANGGQYDALTEDSALLCTNVDRASGFVGVIPPDGENYDLELVTDPSYIRQCATPSGSVNCQAEYVDSPMCEYPVGTPCDSSNPGPGTNYDGVWDSACSCAVFSDVCGDGTISGTEQCEHPTYCDDGSSCIDNADCLTGDQLCKFRRFCEDVPSEVCSTFDPCSVGICGVYDLEPGCAEDCTLVDVACADFTFNDVTADTPPFDTATLFEIEVDATASEKRWADIEIDWGDTTIESIIMNALTFLSDPNATHTYDTASGTPYDVYVTVSNPLSGAINDMCLIDSYTINGVCGDTVVDFDEACDDGNSNEDDLCNNSCQFTTCGDLIRQNPNGEAFNEECDGSADCTACACDSGFAPDGNGACTADPVDGVCGTVNGTSIYDVDDGGDAINSGSPDLCDLGAVISFAFDTNTNTRTWGCAGENGGGDAGCTAFEESCGDAAPNGSEACDDGNIDDTDACKTDCTENICGDGVVETGVEDCDDSNTTSGDGCSDVCAFECADYTLGVGEELCDPADPQEVNDDYTFSADCVSATCNFTCDADTNYIEDPDNLGTCCEDLDDDGLCGTAPACGDGNVDVGEECDDSNVISGDGCSDVCAFECADYTLGVGEELCTPADPQEVNDDYTFSADCVSATCNFACDADTNYIEDPDNLGTCCEDLDDDGLCGTAPTCGDGNVDAGEDCDDSNVISGDGCSDVCAFECADYTLGAGEELCDPADPQEVNDDYTFSADCVSATCNFTCSAGYERDGDSCEIIAGCGNNFLDPSESCDDVNGTVEYDGSIPAELQDPQYCNLGTCEIEGECGDTYIDTTGEYGIVEECDEGVDNSPTGTCTTSCTLTYCGDSVEQDPNGEGTGGPLDNGNEACDSGPEGGLDDEDYCTSECVIELQPWCYIETNPGCTTFNVYWGNWSVNGTNGLLAITPGQSYPNTNYGEGGGTVNYDLDSDWNGSTISYTATVGGSTVNCSVDIECSIPVPFQDPDGEDASGISADVGVDLSIRSQIEVCEKEEGCIIKYKGDDPTTDDVTENNETVDQTLDTLSDDEVTNYGKSVLTAADVSDAFARALYIPIGNGLTALQLFEQLGFFDLLEFQDGEITKKDLIVAMTEILIRLGLLDEVEFELDNYKEAADVRDLRLVAVALRKVMQNSYLGFEDEEVRGRVAVGDRSTDVGALLCRRNGRTGCETEGFHNAASDSEPSKNLEQFYDVDPSSRVGQALSYVNAQRNIFHQKTFNENGSVQVAVLYKTLALSLELEVDSSTVQGEDRGLGYLKALQNAGYFLDIDAADVALNHSVTRGELQMYLTDLLQTAQLLPTTNSKAGPSSKLSTLTTRGELVVALQQLIQLFEMYKQEVSNDIVSRQEQTPARDGN